MASHRPLKDSRHRRRLAAALTSASLLALTWAAPAAAQDDSAQVEISAEANIVLDGSLDEWVDIPVTITESGPQPSANPAVNGSLGWQVVADSTHVYFAATITDEVIVAGEHGENYWNEDSIEFYLNLSGDLSLTEYGPGVVQVRVTPLDIGNTDVGALTISGNGIDQVGVEGVVFATDSGWGTEIAVDVSQLAPPTGGETFGLQVHANGSSAGDRDLKLIWSQADVDDTSFRDPSVFGQGVFVNADADAAEVIDTTEGEAADTGEGSDTEVAEEAALAEPSDLDGSSDAEDRVITGEEQQRSLLYAAIASAIAVLVGGVLFERKRKADETRLTEAAAGAAMSGPEEDPDAEFQAMLESILDEDAK